MNNRRELTPLSPEVSFRPDEINGLASQEEIGGRENQAAPKLSFIRRLPKFFGWWIIIIGVSSYV